MGKCQRQNDMDNKCDPRGSCLTWPRAPWWWGASSSAQCLGHDAGHTAGLCGWPPCGSQWRAASPPSPFPPKFLLWSLFSHLQNQTAASHQPCTAPGCAPCCQFWSWWSLHWLSLQPPGQGLVLPSGAAQGGRSCRGAARPRARQGSGAGIAQGPWQGVRGHCRPGGQPWASPHGHQWDRAAHAGSRPEPQRGGTHNVIQVTVLWSPRHEMGCPSSILREMPFLNWHHLP